MYKNNVLPGKIAGNINKIHLLDTKTKSLHDSRTNKTRRNDLKFSFLMLLDKLSFPYNGCKGRK